MVLILHTNCSNFQIKATLSTFHNNVLILVSTASRYVSIEEQEYSVYQLELVSISWAYQQFSDVIGDQSVYLHTDFAAFS